MQNRVMLITAKGCTRYIGRHFARPASAEYRIVSYDGKMVHLWYIDRETEERVDETTTAESFLGKLIVL